MIQKTIPVGPLQCNCQILVCNETLETCIVDPGADPEVILNKISEIGQLLGKPLQIKALLHTHAHFDHIGATRKVAEHFKAAGVTAPTIFLHKGDEFIYNMLPKQGERYGMRFDEPAPIDRFLEDNEELKFGTLRMNVIHTPGHSPGGVCFHLHEDKTQQISETVFTGDTLFKRSVGRPDLWGGDERVLIKSIHERLMTLDGDTCAWPGHGPKTRIGDEKRENPFL